MKFLYKIHSNYDGFTPARIHERMVEGRLRLGWRLYLESVEEGSEVWIYFHGRHAFANGVYVKGVVDEIDLDGSLVWLAPREVSATEPLTDEESSARVAAAVAVRYRQVFLLPEGLDTPADCSMAEVPPASCAARRCWRCEGWRRVPRVDQANLTPPARLGAGGISSFVAGYWVIPPRSFIHRVGTVTDAVRTGHSMFMRFKTGEAGFAYPLALGAHEALRAAGQENFEAIVPVPLSPDKAEAGEIHRTRLLAAELSRLTGTPVLEVLSLSAPISKRRFLRGGATIDQFQEAYAAALEVDEDLLADAGRVLLIDDVCTGGSTLALAAQALRRACPELQVVACTAGQMIVKAAVVDPAPLVYSSAEAAG